MRKVLPALLLLIPVFGNLFAQWNGDPTENNLVISAVDKGTGQVSTPSAVSDGAGGMFIVWVDNRNSATSGNDIFITRVLANGTTAPGFVAGGNPVCLATGAQSNPVITADGQGGVVVAWTDPRNTGTNSNDVYAQRINPSGAPVWEVNGVAIIASAINENAPAITLISGVEVAIAWRFTGIGTGTDLAFNYVALSNGAKSLATDIVIISEANTQSNQVVVPDGFGGIIVSWGDGRVSNGTSGVVAQRYNGGGIRLWTEGGVFVRTPGGSNTTDPQLIGDGAGGACFAWSDSRNGGSNADIYAQLLNADGAPQWGVAGIGIQVTSAADQQQNPSLIKSGSNFIIGWNDRQNGGTSNTDVYAQAYNVAGTALWNAGSPLGVVTAADQQPLLNNPPVIIEDGMGGAIFIWDDRRNTSSNIDVMAQYVNSVGNKQWLPADGGVAVASRTGSNQGTPMAVQGNNNSLIVAWRDSRSGNANAEIYASQLLINGTLPVTLLEVGATLLGKTVQVQWTSTNEYNLAQYEVEHSNNGNTFISSGSVNARNTPGVHQYSMIDYTPSSGNNFYRVKSVNLDGTFKYSAIVQVNMAYLSDKSVHLYPNPVVAGFNLQLNELPAGSYHVRIVDISGRNIESHRLQKGMSNQTFNLAAGKLSQGYYHILVINEQGETISTQPFMKR
jgi:hypothetical protein